MHLKLMSFFIDKCNLICDNQYGFRAKHTTYMSLLNIMDKISVEMNNRKYSISIFLDLSKPFDTIDHNIHVLLRKFQIYSIRGTALNLFPSYLSRRTQFVSLGDAISNPSYIKCGVPHKIQFLDHFCLSSTTMLLLTHLPY